MTNRTAAGGAEPSVASETRLRILALAYSCRPGGGSEAGAGWIWARLLAQIGDVWLVTPGGTEDEALTRQVLATIPEGRHITVIPVTIGARVDRLTRLVRFPGQAHLRYLVWQVAVSQSVRTQVDVPFDIVWHLTWSTGWLGSVGWRFGPNFVYGPIAGGVATPWRLATTLGAQGFAVEVARAVARWGGRLLNPLARASLSRARLILLQNDDTMSWIPERVRAKAVVFPHIVLDPLPPRRPPAAPHVPKTALFAGRVELWKGPHLAIRTIAGLPAWRLIICGEGSAEAGLRRLAARLGCSARVEFRGSVSRDALLEVMRDETDVFLFPSLRDEGGWVVSEAVAIGLPVVCLDRGGPPTLGGIPVPAGSLSTTVSSLQAAVNSANVTDRRFEALDFQSRLRALRSTLQDAGILSGRETS